MVGVLFAWALIVDKRVLIAAMLLVAIVLFAAAHEFYKDKLDSIWIRPFCTLLICAAATVQILRNRPSAPSLFQRV